MTTIDEPPTRAIPTNYAGYRMRSRLEGRWGVFLDSVGRKYSYETQGYRLPTGKLYLPDFYLPELKTWVEVKGDMGAEDENKILEFVRERSEPIVVLGDIPDPGSNGPHFHILGKPYGSPVVAIFGAVWALTMRGVRPEQHGIPTYVLPHDEFPANGWELKSSPVLSVHTIVDESYRAARSARFEHGENPRRQCIEAASSSGEWFHVPGSEMSHYFIAGSDRCICDRYPLEGHLDRGDKPLLRCWTCESWIGQRKTAARHEAAIAGWDR